MTKISIKRAALTDAQQIRKLEEKVWAHAVTSSYDAAMFVRFGYCFIAKQGTKLVGAIIAFPTRQQEVYVTDVVVAAKQRRSNVGERLYRRLLHTVSQPVISFVDPANSASLALHSKLGGRVARRVKDPYVLGEGFKLLVRFDR